MEKYLNRGGNSAVNSYEIGVGSIIVQFNDGAMYLYNNTIPGAGDVAQMQSFARSGSGLNSYISRNVRKRYAKKLR
jgi:hypothetical protein